MPSPRPPASRHDTVPHECMLGVLYDTDAIAHCPHRRSTCIVSQRHTTLTNGMGAKWAPHPLGHHVEHAHDVVPNAHGASCMARGKAPASCSHAERARDITSIMAESALRP